MNEKPSLIARLLSLWDHLGLDAAHIGAQVTVDISELAMTAPQRIAGLLLCEAPGIRPEPLAALAARLTIVAGDHGIAATVADRAHARLPGSIRVPLADYDRPFWADSVTDHRATIIAAFRGLRGEATSLEQPPRQGSHAGISYRIEGRGPALVLLPLFLAPSQWDAAIPELAQHFTVISLGGRHVGGVSLLEGRSRSPSYAGMLYTLFDVIAPAAGETIVEVGCGSGALLRLLARRLGSSHPLTGLDLNPYLLREAAVLAREDGLDGQIRFGEGNAEHLPFADASVDHAYSVTVLEECDADAALRELWRIVKPGGRVGVIVRAIDLPQVWNVDLPEAILRKIEPPPQLVGAGGVADRSLYRRVAAAGFRIATCFPAQAAFVGLTDSIGRYFEERMMSRLDADEAAIWLRAAAAARADGTLFMTAPHHCVVGIKPAA